MDWRLKVARQSLLARVPFGRALRRSKRRLFGYEPDPSNLRDTLAALAQMRQALATLDRSFSNASILEVGSGWFPTIPVMLCMDGARQVLMSDLNPHMDAVTFASTLRFLQQVHPQDARLASVRRMEDLPLSYLAPFDVAAIPDGALDYVVSRTVLEHIPPAGLRSLFTALRPKMASSGLMLHLIDHSDHLEHSDKSISKINFLTWSERKHALVNALTREGENRLRSHQYKDIFEDCGYEEVLVTREVHPPTRVAAASLKLAAPFSAMAPEQLAVLSSLHVLAVRAGG